MIKSMREKDLVTVPPVPIESLLSPYIFFLIKNFKTDCPSYKALESFQTKEITAYDGWDMCHVHVNGIPGEILSYFSLLLVCL